MNLFKQSQDLSPSQTAQDELETPLTHKYSNVVTVFSHLCCFLSCFIGVVKCVAGGYCYCMIQSQINA